MSIVFSGAKLLIAFFLVISFSIFITSLMRVRNVPAYLLSLYILSFTNIVFVSEIAGLLGLLRNQLFFLAVHLVLTASAFLVWRRTGRAALFEPISRVFARYKWKDLRLFIKDWPDLSSLAVVVGGLYIFGAYLILVVPPNNWDALTCHMVRIGYWLQHGNFWPWPTWDYTQQVYPINAQTQMLWSILFWGSDLFAGFEQWLAALAGMIAIYGLARLLGWGKPQSLFAALIWALLPEILLESTAVQNHLVAGILFTCMIYFFFLGIKSSQKIMLVLSGLALGLSLGTHQIVFFALPGLVLAILILLLINGKKIYRSIFIWGLSSLVAFLFVGSFMYIVNLSIDGNLFGFTGAPAIAKNADTITKIKYYLHNIKVNVPRYIYTSMDYSGLPAWATEPLYGFRKQVASDILNVLPIDIKGPGFNLAKRPYIIGEDATWFGIIGSFLIIPLMIIQGFIGVKKRDPYRLGIIIMIIGYVIIWSLDLRNNNYWSPYQGRYFIIMAAICAPFFASLFRPGRFFSLIDWLLVIISIYVGVYTTIYNYAKPLTGDKAIWGNNRLQDIDLNSSGRFYPTLKLVESSVPAHDTLGLVLFPGFFEYPFFGESLSRTLVPIYPDSKLADPAWISENGINWILLCKPLPTPKNFTEVGRVPSYLNDCSLLKKGPDPSIPSSRNSDHASDKSRLAQN